MALAHVSEAVIEEHRGVKYSAPVLREQGYVT